MGKAFAESGGTPLSSIFKPGHLAQEMEVGALPAAVRAEKGAGLIAKLLKTFGRI